MVALFNFFPFLCRVLKFIEFLVYFLLDFTDRHLSQLEDWLLQIDCMVVELALRDYY